MNAITVIAIFVGIAGVLFGIICLKNRKIDSQKTEIKSKDAAIKKAETNIQEVEDVQKEIKRLDTETAPPEVVPPAADGDSGSRVERLNKLFNGQS